MKDSIYHYRSASRFLIDRVVDRKQRDRDFSVRKWAKEMGFPSHSLLAMILQGKRSLTLKQAPLLANGLGLSTAERMFFQGLIQVENARTPEEKQWCESWLAQLRPEGTGTVREVDAFLAISDWIHPALLALSDTRESYRTAAEAAPRLPYAKSSAEVRAAIERLVELGLLAKDGAGKYRATSGNITTKDDVRNQGAREHAKQCARLAAEVIEEQAILEREFQTATLALPASRLPLAKEMIRKFRAQFEAAMRSDSSDSVYHLNLHFFRLTECPSKRTASKADEGADTTPTPSVGASNEIPGNA